MKIIRALPDQAKTLTHISVSAKSHWGYPKDVIANWIPQLTITPKSIAAHPTYAAISDQNVLGFYQLNVCDDIATLEHLWVSPSHMGKGIGRSLLMHASERAQMTLHINSDPHAEPFYLACGATRVSRLPAPIDGQPDRCLPQMELCRLAT